MRTRIAFAAVLFAGFAAGCAADLAPGPEGDDDIVEPILDEGATLTVDGKADSLNTTATYYRIVRDTRKCAAPLCGGWWVNRVNRTWTQCNDNAWRSTCYVVDVDAKMLGLSDDEEARLTSAMESQQVVLRGRIQNKVYNGVRRGQFRATEAWQSPTVDAPKGTFYRVTDTGRVCVVAPCAEFHEALLNSTDASDVHALNFAGDELAVSAAWTAVSTGPILVAGINNAFVAPLSGQKGIALSATQYYTRVTSEGLKSYAPTAREIAGLSFSDPTSANPPYPRTYRFDYSSWNVAVDDAVAPCAPGVVCIWSGIVTRQATWSVNADRITIAYTSPSLQGDSYGIKYYAQLAVKKDPSGKVVLVELQDDGQITDRRFRQPTAAE